MKIDSHHHLWDLAKYPYDWMVGEEMKPIRRNFEVSDLQSAIAGTGIEKQFLFTLRQLMTKLMTCSN